MYSNGKKVLFMTDDQDLTQKMRSYFLQRYNLLLDQASDALEVLGRIGGDDNSYELAILDEKVVGLPTTSQVLRTIKDQNYSPNVLYLSTLHEIANPNYREELDIPSYYSDEIFRLEQWSENVSKILSLYQPIFECSTIKDVCQNGCQSLVENLDVDCAVSVIPRFDTQPPGRGIVAARYPDSLAEPYDIELKNSHHFRELFEYFKPIHIPDLNADKEFRQELLDKFQFPFRSALIVPMTIGGKFLGYFGLFMQKISRLYRLVEIDSSLRLAEFSAAAAVSIFVSKLKSEGNNL
jgi:hypothetical protein